jgi:hypothetical protein
MHNIDPHNIRDSVCRVGKCGLITYVHVQQLESETQAGTFWNVVSVSWPNLSYHKNIDYGAVWVLLGLSFEAIAESRV